MPEDTDIKDLELWSIIGFDGNAMKGLRVHPDGNNILYPFGAKIAIQNIYSREHKYLKGHTNLISSIAISTSGKYIGSGQINHMGFQAPVMVWDYETLQCIFQHDSHKVRVENVQISVCETFIISLGGRDDANVVVFDFKTGDAICGTFSSNLNAGDAVTIGAMNSRNLCFVTGGVYTLRFWTLDPKNKSVLGADVLMGKIKRKVTCIEEFEQVLAAGFGPNFNLKKDYDPFRWIGGTTLHARPFDGVKIKFVIKFHDDYPFKPPRFKVHTKMYHPNVSAGGDVCMPLVDPEHWRPGQSMVFVMNEFIALMNHPDPNHAFQSQATYNYISNRQKFYSYVNRIMKKTNIEQDLHFVGYMEEDYRRRDTFARYFKENFTKYSYSSNLIAPGYFPITLGKEVLPRLLPVHWNTIRSHQ